MTAWLVSVADAEALGEADADGDSLGEADADALTAGLVATTGDGEAADVAHDFERDDAAGEIATPGTA